MTTFLARQRPPVRKMGRLQRLDWKSHPLTGIPWANWIDAFSAIDPNIASIAPSTLPATANATTLTITGTQFMLGAVIEFDNVAVPTTYVSATSLTTSFDPSVAQTIQVTVRNPNERESNSVPFVVT